MNTSNSSLVDDVVLYLAHAPLAHASVEANLSRDLLDKIESERLTDEPRWNLFRGPDDDRGALDNSFFSYKMRESRQEGLGGGYRTAH